MPRKIDKTEVCGALLTWSNDHMCTMDILSGGTSRIYYRQFREAMLSSDLAVCEPTIRSKWKQLCAMEIINGNSDRGTISWKELKTCCKPELVAYIEQSIENEIKKQKNKNTQTGGAFA